MKNNPHSPAGPLGLTIKIALAPDGIIYTIYHGNQRLWTLTTEDEEYGVLELIEVLQQIDQWLGVCGLPPPSNSDSRI